MLKKRVKIIIYSIILIFMSTVLASNYIFYKPYYIQIPLILFLLVIAIIMKKFIPVNKSKIVYFGCFIALIIAYVYTYEKYTYKVTEDLREPLFIFPEDEGFAEFYDNIYGNAYYNDEHFNGIISYSTNSLEVFDFNQNESHSVQIGVTVNRILEVEYNNGLIYVEKGIQKEGMELFVVDIDTLEIVKYESYDYFMDLHELDGQMYIVKDQMIYNLSSELELSNGIPFIKVFDDSKQFNEYYLFERLIKKEQDFEYELLVYNKDFKYVKTLVKSAKRMALSENNDGDLYVSVSTKKDMLPTTLYDLSFYVFDEDLNLKNTYLIVEDTNYYDGLKLNEYKGYYFVTFLKNGGEFTSSCTIAYNKLFENETILFTNPGRKIVYVIDDKIYVTYFLTHQIYQLSDDDYFKPENTMTFIPPFINLLFYSALFIYPALCINRKRKDIKNYLNSDSNYI